MFSNFIFIALALLTISLMGEVESTTWTFSPSNAFMLGLGAYICLLLLIFFQNYLLKNVSKGFHLFLANIEAIAFLILYHFILGGHRFFQTIPYIGQWQIIPSLFSLLLYFGALQFFYFIYSKIHHHSLSSQSHQQQIRLIIPFAIPFLLFTILIDLLMNNETALNFFFSEKNGFYGTLFFFMVVLAFMVLMLLLLPPIVIWIWQCTPMEEGPLKERLENLCRKASFKHGGILNWTVLENSLTAAIMGILPRLRYVLFTKKIQKQLSYESLEAILAHEIGHNYHRHLLLYPLIILGMAFCTALFSLLFNDGIQTWFIHQNALQLYPIAIFIPYALIVILYFRFVFGFFSRLFERQADLHGLQLGLHPESMITALDDVAIATGFTHLAPNWHHYSLQERIDFLRETIKDPSKAQKHHRRAKRALILYFICIAVILCILMAPLLKDYFPFNLLNQWIHWTSMQISDLINS